MPFGAMVRVWLSTGPLLLDRCLNLSLSFCVREAALLSPKKRWSRTSCLCQRAFSTQAYGARGKAAVSCYWLLLASAAVLATLDFDAFALTSRRPTRVGRSPRSPGPRSPSDTEIAQKKLTKELADVPSAQQLLNILDRELDGQLLIRFQISTAFTCLARRKNEFGGRIAAQRSRASLESGHASLAKSIDCSAQQLY